MNVRLSIDDQVLARAREVAAGRGMSLDQLITEYLEEITSRTSPAEILRELENLWAETSGDSGGSRWKREELHERGGVR